MTIKKRNAIFGRYPSCDMLNNAIRFLLRGNDYDNDHALHEIIMAIHKGNGYFHKDIAESVEIFMRDYWEKYMMPLPEPPKE